MKRRRPFGQALAEFALVFPIVALLAFALVDIGRAVFAYNTLTNAAREAVRVAAVNQIDPIGGPWECSPNRPVEDVNTPHWTFRGCGVAAGAVVGVRDVDVSDPTYTAPSGTDLSCSPVINVGCVASITVVTQFSPITPIAGILIGQMSMSATSQMPVERVFP